MLLLRFKKIITISYFFMSITFYKVIYRMHETIIFLFRFYIDDIRVHRPENKSFKGKYSKYLNITNILCFIRKPYERLRHLRQGIKIYVLYE